MSQPCPSLFAETKSVRSSGSNAASILSILPGLHTTATWLYDLYMILVVPCYKEVPLNYSILISRRGSPCLFHLFFLFTFMHSGN